MKRFIQSLALLVGIAVFMAPVGVGAAGSQVISGSSGYHVYYTQRFITNPASAGPEVAFYKSNPGSLHLGAHSCGGSFYGTSFMWLEVWNPVYTTSNPQPFCLYADAGAGWTGTLAWD